MKQIAKITRITTKKYFDDLKKKSWFFCNAINKKIKITWIYLNHINWRDRDRNVKEIVLRLLTIILVEDILKFWKLYETRKEKDFIYYRIHFEFKWEIFCIVLSEKKETSDIFLFSSFVK